MLDDILSDEAWLVRQSGHDPARANYFETVFTVGNGRIGTRGSLEEGHRGDWPGTYINGVYDSHDSPVIDLVNTPDWLWLSVSVDGVRLDVQSCTVVSHERALDIAHGLLWRRTVFEDAEGRRTRLESVRFASMATRSLCGLRCEITAENHSSPIAVTSGIDGHRRNLERIPAYPHGTTFDPEVRWDKWAKTKHLNESAKSSDADAVYLEMRTAASDITIGVATSTCGYPPAPARRTWGAASAVVNSTAVMHRPGTRTATGEGVWCFLPDPLCCHQRTISIPSAHNEVPTRAMPNDSKGTPPSWTSGRNGP